MFADFDRLLGIDNFYLLHLNDSKVPLGSKKDLHACLGDGCIWENSFESLIHLLNKCKENKIPMVLETHGTDMITLANLQPCEH
jgi:endonuclease IV